MPASITLFGKTTYYGYYVKELNINGFKQDIDLTNYMGYSINGVTYANGHIQFFNVEEPVDLTIQKVWVGPQTILNKSDLEVQFKIYRLREPGEQGYIQPGQTGYPAKVYVSVEVPKGGEKKDTVIMKAADYASKDWTITVGGLAAGTRYFVEEYAVAPGDVPLAKWNVTYSTDGGSVVAGETEKETVTNTHKSTSIEVEKVWVNYTANPGSDTVNIKLYKLNEATGEFEYTNTNKDLPAKTWNGSENVLEYPNDPWYYKWEGLDEGTYRVEETSKNGFVTTYSANNDNGITAGKITVTNYKTNTANGKVGVQKLWLDQNGDATSEIPSTATVTGEIWKKNYKTNGYVVDLYLHNNLSKYEVAKTNGKIIITNADNNTVTVTPDGGVEKTFTITNGSIEISISANTVIRLTSWANNISASPAPTIEQIGDAEYVDNFSFSSANGWHKQIDVTTPNEGWYEYYITNVTETGADGFTLVEPFTNNDGIQTGTILMINQEGAPTDTSLTVTKQWKDASGAAMAWPSGVSVQVTLYKSVNGGAETAMTAADFAAESTLTIGSAAQTLAPSVTLSSGDAVTWDHLPLKDAGDHPITYTARETAVTGGTLATADGHTTVTVGGTVYDSVTTQSGKNVTITNAARKNVSFAKAWDTEDLSETITVEKDGTEYQVARSALSVKVRLHRYVNGTNAATYDFAADNPTYNLTLASPWTASWSDLPTAEMQGGSLVEYVYEVEETDVTAVVDGATVSVKSLFNAATTTDANGNVTITNTYQGDGSYSLAVTKHWVDASDNPSTGPDIQFQLVRHTATAGGSGGGQGGGENATVELRERITTILCILLEQYLGNLLLTQVQRIALKLVMLQKFLSQQDILEMLAIMQVDGQLE